MHLHAPARQIQRLVRGVQGRKRASLAKAERMLWEEQRVRFKLVMLQQQALFRDEAYTRDDLERLWRQAFEQIQSEATQNRTYLPGMRWQRDRGLRMPVSTDEVLAISGWKSVPVTVSGNTGVVARTTEISHHIVSPTTSAQAPHGGASASASESTTKKTFGLLAESSALLQRVRTEETIARMELSESERNERRSLLAEFWEASNRFRSTHFVPSLFASATSPIIVGAPLVAARSRYPSATIKRQPLVLGNVGKLRPQTASALAPADRTDTPYSSSSIDVSADLLLSTPPPNTHQGIATSSLAVTNKRPFVASASSDTLPALWATPTPSVTGSASRPLFPASASPPRPQSRPSSAPALSPHGGALFMLS
eukprot:TRINITY_DN32402_c0_g1_i1.p1 TRINITY_DN32402_c0_g1~~TRINITY_DN32402_c0_g1_i1.p1  ORF type:complete len:419 (-),score=57.59 TRINITY_DN32402_c0_g1_i1:56-1162(-)